MAKAKLAVPRPILPDVVLELTGEEAATLRCLCTKVAGDPVFSPRRHVDAIRVALDHASSAYKNESETLRVDGVIGFDGTDWK